MATEHTQTDDAEAFVEHFKALPFNQQKEVLTACQAALTENAEKERAELLERLHALDALTGRTEPAASGRQVGEGRSRGMAPMKFRSRKEPTLQWSGRGSTPRWLAEEMAESGQAKDAFLIGTDP